MRNNIEHFDEKLDAYLANGVAGQTLPEYVGQLPESGDVPTHIFRAYYLDAGLFEMLGNRYRMQPIADELLRLHDLLLDCRRTGRSSGYSLTFDAFLQTAQKPDDVASRNRNRSLQKLAPVRAFSYGLAAFA